MIRRLLLLAAVAWVVRWALLLLASELERRKRPSGPAEGSRGGRPPQR